jgi:hypothetical protein
MSERKGEMDVALLGPQFVAEQSRQDIELIRESLREKSARLEIRAKQTTDSNASVYYQRKKQWVEQLEDSLRQLERNLWEINESDTTSQDSQGR